MSGAEAVAASRTGRRRWLLGLPPLFAAGTGLFAWTVLGALGHHGQGRTLAVLAVVVAVWLVWLAESYLLAQATARPRQRVAELIALSWAPLIILPVSAPYFDHRVASLFLGAHPPAARVLELAAWLLGLAVAGSVLVKLLIFWPRAVVAVDYVERHAMRLLLTAAGLYFVVFTALAFLSYHWYNSFYHADLAQYNQTLWASLRGHIFYSAGLEITSNTYLSTHVSPFLLVFILPFYALRQEPQTYLLLRVLGLALATVPLFYCVRRLTASAVAGLLLAVAFLFHPEIAAQPFTSGYETVFVAAPFFAAFYFFLERRFGLFLALLVITVSVREDFVPAALVFGIYALLVRRSRKWVLAPLALGAVWGAAVLIIFRLTIVHNMFALYFGHLGDSPTAMIHTLIFHPIYSVDEVRRLQTSYLYNLLAPEGLVLPFAGLASLFALPNIVINVLRGSDPSGVAGGIAHYSVLVVAAFWLTIAGLIGQAQKRLPGREKLAAVVAALVVVIMVAASAHIWVNFLPKGPPPDAAALTRALAMVPPDASFSSNDGRALSHVPARWGLYDPLLWEAPQPPDRLPQGIDRLPADYVLVKPFGNSMYNDAGAFAFLTAPGTPYRLIFEQNGIRLFHKQDDPMQSRNSS